MFIVIDSLAVLLLVSLSLLLPGVVPGLATGSTIATPTGRHVETNREVVEVVGS